MGEIEFHENNWYATRTRAYNEQRDAQKSEAREPTAASPENTRRVLRQVRQQSAGIRETERS